MAFSLYHYVNKSNSQWLAMALTLGIKTSGRNINHPCSLSANKSIRNYFIQQILHGPLKYGFAAWAKLI
jgi:hypothetical protein